jgi:hypothetical protein
MMATTLETASHRSNVFSSTSIRIAVAAISTQSKLTSNLIREPSYNIISMLHVSASSMLTAYQ